MLGGGVVGPILGAFLLTALPEVLRFAGDYRMIIYGLIVLGVMVASPQGLEDRIQDVARWLTGRSRGLRDREDAGRETGQ